MDEFIELAVAFFITCAALCILAVTYKYLFMCGCQ